MLFFIICVGGCNKDYTEERGVASVNFQPGSASDIGGDFIILYGTFFEGHYYIYSTNGEYDKCGVCYSESNSTPTINDHVHYSEAGDEVLKIFGLKEKTTYYLRSFIQKENAIAYSDEVYSYTTLPKYSGTWVRKANFAGVRKFAVGFSIGNKGYVGTGYSNHQDFWEYDPTANSWTQKADFAGGSRYEAVGFSIGNKGYVGTGYSSGNGEKQDFWEYDPATNNWTKKADFAGGNSRGAIGFSIGNKGYMGGGGGYYADKYFWEYNPASNTWTQKADFTGKSRKNAVGFSIGNKGYMGTGGGPINEYFYANTFWEEQDFWEYDPATNRWTQKADVPIRTQGAVGFAIGNKGYVGIGNENSKELFSFWEYDPNSNRWTQKSDFSGGGRCFAVGFSIEDKGYVGTGFFYGHDRTEKDFWEFTP